MFILCYSQYIRVSIFCDIHNISVYILLQSGYQCLYCVTVRISECVYSHSHELMFVCLQPELCTLLRAVACVDHTPQPTQETSRTAGSDWPNFTLCEHHKDGTDGTARDSFSGRVAEENILIICGTQCLDRLHVPMCCALFS